MPYPFAASPTWRTFLQDLSDKYGVRESKAKMVIISPQKEEFPIYCLERDLGGKTLYVEFQCNSMDERVAPTNLRRICEGLKIDPKAFGFELG
jgi:hypothetical protein